MLEPAGGLRKGLLREGGRPQGTPLRDAPLPGGGYAKPSRGRAWLAEGATGPRGRSRFKEREGAAGAPEVAGRPHGPGGISRPSLLSPSLFPTPAATWRGWRQRVLQGIRRKPASPRTSADRVSRRRTRRHDLWRSVCLRARTPGGGLFPPARGEVSWLVARAHGQPATLERKGRGWLAGTAGLGVHGTMVGGECRDREGADVAALSRSLQGTERLSKGRLLRNRG